MPGSSKNALDYLDDLPEHLYVPVVTHHHGTLEQRCLGLLQWRASLLAGHLPDVKILDWPLLQERLILIEKLKLSTLPQ
ncbi:MAG: hypothetical protein ACN4GM_05630, partial [Gammaproteobacteria bacterium]